MWSPAELSHRSAAQPHMTQLDLSQEGVLAVSVSNLGRNAGVMMEFIGALRKSCRSMSGSGLFFQRRRRRRERPQQSELRELEFPEDGRKRRLTSIGNESFPKCREVLEWLATLAALWSRVSLPACNTCTSTSTTLRLYLRVFQCVSNEKSTCPDSDSAIPFIFAISCAVAIASYKPSAMLREHSVLLFWF